MSVTNIRFNGNDYLLIGDKEDGAIATKEQYENFDTSYAHLSDGEIVRFGNIIGTIDDITFLDEEEG